jgi:thioredoxin 2
MTDSPVQIICPMCSTKNRLPKVKLNDKPLCGKCGKPVLSTTPIVGSDKNFSRFITHNDLPVVVDFWALWCGPCKQFAPTFEQVAVEMHTEACFVKLDTELNQNTAGGHSIRSIPTLMILHHGKEIARISGALPKTQFKQWLAENLPSV